MPCISPHLPSAPQFISDLPPLLQAQLQLSLSRDLFLQVPFFSTCDAVQLSELCAFIKREYRMGGQTIVHEGEEGVGLFVISRGFLRVRGRQGNTKFLLTHPDFFGEEALYHEMSSERIDTLTLCCFLVLDRTSFTEFLECNPKVSIATSPTTTTLTSTLTLTLTFQVSIAIRRFNAKHSTRKKRTERLENVKVALKKDWHVLDGPSRQVLLAEIRNMEASSAVWGKVLRGIHVAPSCRTIASGLRHQLRRASRSYSGRESEAAKGEPAAKTEAGAEVKV